MNPSLGDILLFLAGVCFVIAGVLVLAKSTFPFLFFVLIGVALYLFALCFGAAKPFAPRPSA